MDRALLAVVTLACVSLLGMVSWPQSSLGELPWTVANMEARRRTLASASSGKQPQFQFSFEICNGLTNQRIQLVDGTLLGLFLGAQILLPQETVLNGAQFVSVETNKQPLDRILNMSHFENEIQQLYHDFWCRHPTFQAHRLWCSETAPAAIEYEELQSRTVVDVNMEEEEWSASNLMLLGDAALKHVLHVVNTSGDARGTRYVWRVTVPCDFWFKVKVVEGSALWEAFWKIDEALKFTEEILQIGRTATTSMLHLFSQVAREKAVKHGYPTLESRQGYHVVHLRAEQDWREHCKLWFSWRDKRDNCLNNTYQIGNVLLSEGISPALPVYLATGLSEPEIQVLSEIHSMQSFFNVYTVVTKGMLGLPKDVGSNREYWAAVDYMFSQTAAWFVGNSISTFSALAMEGRTRRGLPILPYNGGTMALETIEIIRPSRLTMIPPMRPQIKWLFTLPRNLQLHDPSYNSTMLAVKSALAKTTLIPVCVTAEDPNASIFVKLVSMGVRMIHHRPAWEETAQSIFRENDLDLTQQEEFLAQLLLIDLPLLGLLDEFVLHTDRKVLFLRDVSWKDLLGKYHLRRDLLRRYMAGNAFFEGFASSGHLGVPRFVAIDELEDCRVMLMNLRRLQDSAKDFLHFVIKNYLKRQDLTGGSYLCPHNAFYTKSKLAATLLWKPESKMAMASMVYLDWFDCAEDTPSPPFVRSADRARICADYSAYVD